EKSTRAFFANRKDWNPDQDYGEEVPKEKDSAGALRVNSDGHNVEPSIYGNGSNPSVDNHTVEPKNGHNGCTGSISWGGGTPGEVSAPPPWRRPTIVELVPPLPPGWAHLETTWPRASGAARDERLTAD